MDCGVEYVVGLAITNEIDLVNCRFIVKSLWILIEVMIVEGLVRAAEFFL